MDLDIHQGIDYSALDMFGVGMCQYQGRQNHVAILFKDIDDKVLLLHVGAHKESIVDVPSTKYIWFNICDEFHPIRKQVMLASLWQIAEVNNDVKARYGLDHGLFCIDPESGKFNSNYTNATGFTCASFVIEVFLSFGVKLIEWESWPAASYEDADFQKKVLGYLHGRLDKDVTLEYLKSQYENFGGSRFRPEEIAASTLSVAPITWEKVQPSSKFINDLLSDFTDKVYSTV